MTYRFRSDLTRLVASISAAALLAPQAVAGPAANKVFTIAKYPVEARAKDAVAAKAKAHADGEQAALGSLFKRLIPVTAYNRLAGLKGIGANQLIDGVAVREESNSSTQYIASLDFSFQPDAVRGLLSREGVPFVDSQAPKAVLIPIMTEAGGKHRAAGGTWNQVWKELDLENTLTPLTIDALDPAIPGEAVQGVLTGSSGVEGAFQGPYKSGYIVLAAAEVDQGSKRLNVTLAGQDAAGPIAWTRSYRIEDGDVGYAMDLAAVVSLGVLEGRWKAAKMEGMGELGSAQGSLVQMEVEFSSADEWNDLRGRILDLPGVDNVEVAAVTATTASVSVTYPGGGATLAAVLARQGLSLTGGDGRWVLRSSL